MYGIEEEMAAAGFGGLRVTEAQVLFTLCLYDVGRILRTFKIKKNVEVTDNGKIII